MTHCTFLRPLLLIEFGKLTVFDILVTYGSSALLQMYISLIKRNLKVGEPKSMCRKIGRNLIWKKNMYKYYIQTTVSS